MKGLIRGKKESAEFGKVLRISMRRFYLKEIYMIDIRSIRTTKEIRKEQIKKGKELLNELQYLDD